MSEVWGQTAQQAPIRRASLSPEERAARAHRDTEDDQSITSLSRSSVVRHRHIGNIYVIPFKDGSEMRVTERELDDLPKQYQRVAQLITPQIAPPRQRRQPHPKRPTPSDTVYEMPPARETEAPPRSRLRRLPRFHWLVWVGGTVFVMVVGWMILSALGTWAQTTLNDWQYGRPRTYQVDVNVGHGTSAHPDSHFIAENLNGQIMVIEIAGNDPSHTRIYKGPTLYGPGVDLIPVTLSFEDVNGDGRPDLVMHVKSNEFIFLNQPDGTFKPAPN